MGENKFNKILNKKDVFSTAFGAMIGWGWVVLAGEWILGAGSLGAMLAFALGGLMVLFVGLVYAELTTALPQVGGAYVFSKRALGVMWSFICTWALVFGYVGVVAFEACAFPTVIQYIVPGFLQGYLYTIAGFDVYLSWIVVALMAAIFIMVINCVGTKTAAVVQTVLTNLLLLVGIALMAGSVVNGSATTMEPLFENGLSGILTVAVMTPFMFLGFDVVPQAAEEINLSLKKVGSIMVLSIIMALLWYVGIIFAVSIVMSKSQMLSSTLVTADAMMLAFGNSKLAANVVVLGGMAGIITSWNSFLIGGSRALFALAESKMLPSFLSKLHPKYKTPVNAIMLISLLSCIAPFFGRKTMVWISNASSFGVVVAYLLVSVSFLLLRSNEPNLPRPYKIKCGNLIGVLAILLSGFMGLLYVVPFFSSALAFQEWIIVGVWSALGIGFYLWAKVRQQA